MRDDEFERLYEEHAPGLLAYLAYRCGDRVIAEDVLADTFEKVLKTRIRFDPRRGSKKNWLYSIATNRLRDVMRSRQAEQRALERVRADGPAEPGRIEGIEERDELMAALAQLSDEEREALSLRFGADMTVPEIAKLLGEPLPRVEGRVYRGLRKLRDILD